MQQKASCITHSNRAFVGKKALSNSLDMNLLLESSYIQTILSPGKKLQFLKGHNVLITMLLLLGREVEMVTQ